MRFTDCEEVPSQHHLALQAIPGYINRRIIDATSLASQVFVSIKSSTLQGINISHLGKRKTIFKMPFLGDMLIPWRVFYLGSLRCIFFFQTWHDSFSINTFCCHLIYLASVMYTTGHRFPPPVNLRPKS